MMRWLFILHRYLGMFIGVVMALWCLSGFVMMYVQYPELSHRERLAGLEPLALGQCCSPLEADFPDTMPVDRLEIEMLTSRPVLRFAAATPPYDLVTLDLQSGKRLDSRDPEILVAAAESWRREAGISGSLRARGAVMNDQWTVFPSFAVHKPLFKFSASGDVAGTEWYVSSKTGEVIQVTTRKERFWNWVGSVVHWLYPTMLRQHATAWYQVVVWLSLAGTFLTVFGLTIGIRQWRVGREGGPSPYRGSALWHHYTGLFFGIFVLTWVVSGLFSMNPWGLLEGEGAGGETARLRGTELQWQDVKAFAARLPELRMPAESVRLEGFAQAGEFRVMIHDALAGRERFDGRTLRAAPVTDSEWMAIPQQLLPGEVVASAGWLESEDAYYYDHHQKLVYPVYRVVFDNPGRSRYYFDAVSGELVRKVDGEQRWQRWLFLGLHRGDFTTWLRSRPVWDIFMWVLMLGVTVSTVTGAYMGIRRFGGPRRIRR